MTETEWLTSEAALAMAVDATVYPDHLSLDAAEMASRYAPVVYGDDSWRLTHARILRDIFTPFRPVTLLPEWRTSTVLALAEQMYDSRGFSAMPILADALQDTGCSDEAILAHCRGSGPHVRGCWVVDACLGKL